MCSTGTSQGHYAPARFQSNTSQRVLLATQNVDGLHQRAGSKDVIELHGSIWRTFDPDGSYDVMDFRARLPEIPPRCPDTGHYLRPGVVWFGEALPAAALSQVESALESAKLVLVVGTSSTVYPVAALPMHARERGSMIIEVNLEPTPLTGLASCSLLGHSGEILPQLLGN